MPDLDIEPWQLYPMPPEQIGKIREYLARRERIAVERGKAEGIAERLVGVEFLTAVVCAVRDDPAHQAMAEDEVCGNCEEIAREIQRHVIAKTGGSDA
ncbi:hypothetical protein ABT369_38700 [Dactylosporangium sp. NPDC000244]|uniref:hypothetical protein n=1 Tax=Dactylosporangium sp. NPDC000244 TaxID=3154365 RepID=UPI00331B576B